MIKYKNFEELKKITDLEKDAIMVNYATDFLTVKKFRIFMSAKNFFLLYNKELKSHIKIYVEFFCPKMESKVLNDMQFIEEIFKQNIEFLIYEEK